MSYSATLRFAMDEIKQILVKHDITGMVVLHRPSNMQAENPNEAHGFGEHMMHLESSYSAIKTEMVPGKGMLVVVQGKAEHYGGDKKKRNRAVAITSNMLQTLSEMAGMRALQLIRLADQVKHTWDTRDLYNERTDGSPENN